MRTAGLPEVELYQFENRWGQIWRYWLVSEDDETFTVAFAGTTKIIKKGVYSYKKINISKENKMYGRELILDMCGCDVSRFNRPSIERWLMELCILINMERCDLHFWDYVGYEEEKAEAPIHLVGTTAVQFISTSNITIHTIDLVEECYINLFSCKNFNVPEAVAFTLRWFMAKSHVYRTIERGVNSRCRNM